VQRTSAGHRDRYDQVQIGSSPPVTVVTVTKQCTLYLVLCLLDLANGKYLDKMMVFPPR
jgi:hypothetical protein